MPISATPTSITAQILPTIDSDCTFKAPIGYATLDYLEVYVAPDEAALEAELPEVYELDPNEAIEWTFTTDSTGDALIAGHEYQFRIREIYKTAEGVEYNNSADSFYFSTTFPNTGYDVTMTDDLYISASLDDSTSAENAKFRAVFVEPSGLFKTFTVKYFDDAGETDPWRDYDYNNKFDKNDTAFVIATVSKKSFYDVWSVAEGTWMETTDMEYFQSPRVFLVKLNKNREVKQFQEIGNKGNVDADICGEDDCEVDGLNNYATPGIAKKVKVKGEKLVWKKGKYAKTYSVVVYKKQGNDYVKVKTFKKVKKTSVSLKALSGGDYKVMITSKNAGGKSNKTASKTFAL